MRNLKKCITCRKHEGIAYNPPNTPDLPKERVSIEPPFTYTGLDFAGPFYVRDEVRKVSPQVQEVSKVFVCLFTCASTRVTISFSPRDLLQYQESELNVEIRTAEKFLP